MTKKECIASMPSIAYCSKSAGIEIKKIDNDTVYAVSGAWGSPQMRGYHRVKLQWNNAGVPFFRVNGWTVYLDECIRM